MFRKAAEGCKIELGLMRGGPWSFVSSPLACSVGQGSIWLPGQKIDLGGVMEDQWSPVVMPGIQLQFNIRISGV